MRTIHNLTVTRQIGQKWGFGITGGKDVSLTFRVEKVALASPAGDCGLKNLDYLIKVNGKEVFDLNHNELVKLIRDAGGETLELEVERGDGDVVPSFDLCFPRAKEDGGKQDNYYEQAMKQGLGPDSSIPCMFTACGPPRLKMGKYNVPIGLYSEDTILELGSSGNHGFVEPDKLAPDACPRAKNRKRFDPKKSSTLEVLMAHEKGDLFSDGPNV